MALRGVIFDLDGVLCDSEPMLAEAAQTMFRERYQLDVPRDAFKPYIGAGEDHYLQAVGQQYGATVTLPDDKQATYDHYLKAIRGRLRPMPGVIDMIQGCLARGIHIAVATNAERRKVEANLREIGLPPDKFHAVVAAEDITRKKPDPEIFTLAAHQMGLSPSDCLVIEDSPPGIAATKAAGAHCLGVTTSFDADALCQQGADWTAANPAELPMAAVCW
jgi:HAD superfamily hydrolase (TIGR01509 family)